jgi:hypothetical protein
VLEADIDTKRRQSHGAEGRADLDLTVANRIGLPDVEGRDLHIAGAGIVNQGSESDGIGFRDV